MGNIVGPTKGVPGRPKISLPVMVVVGVLLSSLAVGALWSQSSDSKNPSPPAAVTMVPTTRPASAVTATKDRPYINGLGMKFVPVPGTDVLFSVWKTRRRDFTEYARKKPYDQSGGIFRIRVEKIGEDKVRRSWKLDSNASWQSPGFGQTYFHPVVGVSWNEAREFCEWLTLTEREGGRLGPKQRYRLPTDAEWSAAVGPGNYPWGDEWPPPAGAGNYFDEAGAASLRESQGWKHVPGNDGYARTSPVGSFRENHFGLFDLGGNAEEWCEDEYRASMNEAEVLKAIPLLENERDSDGKPFRVLRGGTWSNSTREVLLSSCRDCDLPTKRSDEYGFRVVLADDLPR